MSFKDLALLGLTSLIILLTGSSAIFSSRTANLSLANEKCEFPPLSLLQLKDGDVFSQRVIVYFQNLLPEIFLLLAVCLIAVLFLRLMTNIR